MLLHVATGMLHAGRGEHRPALEAFAAAARMESQLSGVHALAPRITGWLAAAQARLGIPDEARATLTEFSAEPERIGLIYDGQMGAIYNARAVICLTEGDPAGALDALRGVLDTTPPFIPSFTVVESHLLAGIAHLRLGDQSAASAAAEAALAAAEPDRLMYPFAMAEAADLLDALPRHQTAHGALLADVVDLLRGEPAREHRSSAPIPTRGAQPDRTPRTAIPADKSDAARDRERALCLGQHRQHPHPQHLFQARCPGSLRRRQARTGAEAPLNRAPPIADLAQTPSRAQSPDSGVAGSLCRAAG